MSVRAAITIQWTIEQLEAGGGVEMFDLHHLKWVPCDLALAFWKRALKTHGDILLPGVRFVPSPAPDSLVRVHRDGRSNLLVDRKTTSGTGSAPPPAS